VDNPRVQVLALEGFELLEIVALWHGEPTAIVRSLLEEGQRYIRELWPESASADTMQKARLTSLNGRDQAGSKGEGQSIAREMAR
jgi:hypothetical protein